MVTNSMQPDSSHTRVCASGASRPNKPAVPPTSTMRKAPLSPLGVGWAPGPGRGRIGSVNPNPSGAASAPGRRRKRISTVPAAPVELPFQSGRPAAWAIARSGRPMARTRAWIATPRLPTGQAAAQRPQISAPGDGTVKSRRADGAAAAPCPPLGAPPAPAIDQNGRWKEGSAPQAFPREAPSPAPPRTQAQRR